MEFCNDFFVLYCIAENLCGVKELRELGLGKNRDSWGPEHSLMYDGIRVVDCVRVSLIGITVAPFWTHWSVVGGLFGTY